MYYKPTKFVLNFQYYLAILNTLLSTYNQGHDNESYKKVHIRFRQTLGAI